MRLSSGRFALHRRSRRYKPALKPSVGMVF